MGIIFYIIGIILMIFGMTIASLISKDLKIISIVAGFIIAIFSSMKIMLGNKKPTLKEILIFLKN